MKVNDVAKELGISVSHAYKIMQQLNKELKEKGYMTIAGGSTANTLWKSSATVERKGSNPMAVYKEEKTGTWRVIYRYTDWTGEKKQTQKRGFQTKREAQAWEREQLHKATSDLDMTFKSFVEQYTADMQTRIKENTWATKEHIIRSKLLPYFGKSRCAISLPSRSSHGRTSF